MTGYKNPPESGRFQPGDPRINRKGRPKNFKQLRALAVSVAQEPVKEGETITRIEKMLRDMMKSDNPSDRALILKYAFGNVPDEVKQDNTGTVKIVVSYADTDDTENA